MSRRSPALSPIVPRNIPARQHPDCRPNWLPGLILGVLVGWVVVERPCQAWGAVSTRSQAATEQQKSANRSLSASPGTSSKESFWTVRWPSWSQWQRTLSLRDYNSRVVLLGTTLLGCAAGMIGSFTLLRRRALMGDAISHATLPGICVAFMVAVVAGASSKSLSWLLLGATITGLMGVGVILAIRRLTHLKEDTALGAVLSVFFGAGISLMGIVQQMQEGHAAGLEAFIYGKTASMNAADARLITLTAIASMGCCLLFFREFKLLCFDDQYAGSAGYPVLALDLLLMSLVVAVTIVGLQAVGLILMIALLVIPAAAARFWTQKLRTLVLVSAGLGAFSGWIGAASSAVFENLPSGAMIVLVCSSVFLLSLFFGKQRGILVRWWRRRVFNRSIARQHLLRAMYEILEYRLGLEHMARHDDARELAEVIPIGEILIKRSWSASQLRREMRRAARQGQMLVTDAQAQFTLRGLKEAERLTKQHRLWELYLITYADVATSRVDRDADAIEHVLEPEIIAELESLLERQYPQFPASPHRLNESRNAEDSRAPSGERSGHPAGGHDAR